METLTPNYHLRKQDENEFYTETINSDNMDTIDVELKKSATHISDTGAHVTTTKQTAWDGKSTRHEFTAAVTTTWVGSSAPYTQAVTITGIVADDDPIINPVYSATNATAILEKAAWGNVGKVETTLNTITLTCFEEKPVTAFNLQLLVVR